MRLAAIAAVIGTTMEMISDTGIESAIIHHPRGDDSSFLNTAWLIQTVRGLLIAILLAALADPLSRLFHEPRLALVILLTGCGFLARGALRRACRGTPQAPGDHRNEEESLCQKQLTRSKTPGVRHDFGSYVYITFRLPFTILPTV